MGKGGSPAPPDYPGAAEKQAASSEKINTQQTTANRPNQVTPWGSSTWNNAAGIDPSTGQPVTKWNQSQTLTPELQAALDSQVGLTRGKSDLAQSFMGRVEQDYSKPFDYGKLGSPQQGANTKNTDAPAFAAEREKYTQNILDQLRPEQQFQEEATRTRLANQGLTAGSEAYNRELQRLNDQQSRERMGAIDQGGVEQQRMNAQMLGQQQQAFSQGGIARQQAIAEEAQRRGMSLNEMNALLTGQQVNPSQMPTFSAAGAAQPTNYGAAAGQQGQWNLTQQAHQDQQNAQLWGGVGSAAGAAALLYGMGAFSDIRLKSNIIKVGDHPIGVGIYEYDIFGRRERGVMAQELMRIAPDLVMMHRSGYLMVNYGGL